MLENTRKRVQLAEDGTFSWKQNKTEEKTAYSNTVQQDNILFSLAPAARKAEKELLNENPNRPAPSNRIEAAKNTVVKQQQELAAKKAREGLDIQEALLRQEKKLGMKGTLSIDELAYARNDPSLIGKTKPMDINKKDVKGLETKRTRSLHTRKSLLPSQRRDRLNRKKLEKNRNMERNRIQEKQLGKKELSITDKNGKKISIERLRKLRGLSKETPLKRRDLHQIREQIASKNKVQSLPRNLRREEYTR
ncbi:MAG: hypothetical protein MJ250_06390 [Alphaproteobacteria bacterium]|nr:hypothetical protein [Alphaproteobacteria bacterium]